jgi:hypothetical protein
VAQVFISHAGADLAVAETPAEWITGAGHGVFLDRDLHAGMEVGDTWPHRLHKEIGRSDALVAVVTTAFTDSPWCAAEVGIAQAHGLRILPVRAQQAQTIR